ncbi:MAG: tRNA pseudouridine(55) synthase TruB [Clostridia bacterium]|nr:tRNA pseudouridine(55) synthase TruB [Clostridia bacterium]
MSSAQVVGIVRRFLNGEKVGHGGTLDPEAAGVLPLMIGKATRLFDYLQEKEKGYVAELAFGCATDTQDAQGKPVAWGDAYPDVAALREALRRFVGEMEQSPPMYSALKREGKRLYQLAREGRTVDREARKVTVHELTLLAMTENHGALLFVRCSKGFYVRALCHDIGQALDCPAHLRFLLRTRSGAFVLEDAHTLESLREAAELGLLRELLLPPDIALKHIPHAEVPAELAGVFFSGGPLPWRNFFALQGTLAENGTPAGLWLNGRLIAIGQKAGEWIKLRCWLGDSTRPGCVE